MTVLERTSSHGNIMGTEQYERIAHDIILPHALKAKGSKFSYHEWVVLNVHFSGLVNQKNLG